MPHGSWHNNIFNQIIDSSWCGVNWVLKQSWLNTDLPYFCNKMHYLCIQNKWRRRSEGKQICRFARNKTSHYNLVSWFKQGIVWGFWGQSGKLTRTLLTYHEMISGLQVSLWLQGSFSRLCPWILHFVLFSCLLLSLSWGITLTLVVSLFLLLTWLGYSAVVWTVNSRSCVGVFLVSLNWVLFQTFFSALSRSVKILIEFR